MTETSSYKQILSEAYELIETVADEKEGASDISISDRARDLLYEFERDLPHLANICESLSLVKELVKQKQKEGTPARAKKLLDQKNALSVKKPRSERPSGASRRQIDDWVEDILRAIVSAVPREQLLKDFIERYRFERKACETQSAKGPWLFVFELEGKELKPVQGLNVHEQAFHERCKKHISQWSNDPFLRQVFGEKRDIDTWYAPAWESSQLFNDLLEVGLRRSQEPDYWVHAVFLPGRRASEGTGIFLIYRNAGDSFSPTLAPGQKEDARLLVWLGLAWRHLEHQVRSLAQLSEAGRLDLINQIAPGLLHHEIGFNMRTAYDQAYELQYVLNQISGKNWNPKRELALRYVRSIGRLVLRIHTITDAFNNLDKRAKIEKTQLHSVLIEVKTLLHHRLGAASVELSWDQEKLSNETIRSDIVLLGQVLINIINNAINAILEMRETDSRFKRIIQVEVRDCEKNKVSLCLFNTGPGIPNEVSEEIFRRGFTTRRSGHGQGLYLARLVAHYLGGSLELITKEQLPDGYNVGFCLAIDRYLKAEEGMAREAE